MKLKTLLKSLDESVLEEIRAFWDLPEPSANGTPFNRGKWVEYLYPRLQNAGAFRAAHEKIDPQQRNLISFLAIQGGNMEQGELRKRFFGGDREAMTTMLDALMRSGFVFHERWDDLPDRPHVYGVPEPFLRFIELPYFWQGYLGAVLRDLPREALARLAANGLKLPDPPVKSDHLIHEIRRVLTDPERLRVYIDTLPEDQREVLFLVLQRRGVCLYRDLIEMVQKRRPELGRSNPIEKLLASSGLLFQATDNPDKFNNLLRVPRDLYYVVTNHFVRDNRGLEALDAIGQVDRDQQPKVICDNGISVLRDIVIFVGQIASHAVRRLGNGGIGKNDLKKILPSLSANKTLKYAQFLAYYCIQRKFLVPTGDHWSVSSTFPDALHDSRAFYTDLYNTWLETNEWNEEYIDGDCVHADAFPTNLVNVVELRGLVLKNLARVPFDTWIIGPRFIESLLSQIEVQIPHRGGKARPEKHNRINYLVIETILCESLYWLGLVTLGLHDDSGFQTLGNRCQVEPDRKAESNRPNGGATRLDEHFNFNPRPFLPDCYQFHLQITGLGRSLMAATLDGDPRCRNGGSEVALPFRDDLVHFTVLPNHDVIAPPDLNLHRFYELTRIADARNIDVMSLLTITQDSIRAAMDQGKPGEEILEFLKEGCPSGLPETVSHLIRECGSRYGEITMGYAGGYIRVSDPVLLEDLRNNKALASFFKDVPSETILLLSRGADVSQVSRELKKCGFMPQIDNENVYASAEGRLRFSLAPDDLCSLLSILRFVLSVEKELGVSLTDDKARALAHSLRPSNHAQSRLQHSTDVLSKVFEKNFQDALKRKLDAITRKYRKQMNEFLAQKSPSRDRAAYAGANPATETPDIRKLIRFAIDSDATILLRYVRTTRDEIEETVRPESLNNEKVFAFCEDRQSYCAYRVSRILLARLS
ncbi:helicase-associated domain-containing protein [Candidatus Sumerlaeota bacterium]|nr:helicase-associated domain-containing protein [Candidatus Sumerlaeota bacterium]